VRNVKGRGRCRRLRTRGWNARVRPAPLNCFGPSVASEKKDGGDGEQFHFGGLCWTADTLGVVRWLAETTEARKPTFFRVGLPLQSVTDRGDGFAVDANFKGT